MGVAVARRTVFRPEDEECFGRVADRVAAGNMALLGRALTDAERQEQARLRNAIATGALLTSGRHLQHGDASQPERNMEVFTNCATAITSFAKFYLLLNGSGVGRSYDDALTAVDWADAPDAAAASVALRIRTTRTARTPCAASASISGCCRGAPQPTAPGWWRRSSPRTLSGTCAHCPNGTTYHRIADSREGWAKAVEMLEAMTFRRERDAHPAAGPVRHPPRRLADPRHAGTAGVRSDLAAARVPEHPPPCDRSGVRRWSRGSRRC